MRRVKNLFIWLCEQPSFFRCQCGENKGTSHRYLLQNSDFHQQGHHPQCATVPSSTSSELMEKKRNLDCQCHTVSYVEQKAFWQRWAWILLDFPAVPFSNYLVLNPGNRLRLIHRVVIAKVQTIWFVHFRGHTHAITHSFAATEKDCSGKRPQSDMLFPST